MLQGESTPKASPGVGAVSSTMDVDEPSPSGHHHGHHHSRKTKVRREPATTTCVMNGEDRGDKGFKDEPDFIETNCHWVGCSLEFCTQGELVKVRGVVKQHMC